MSSTEAKGDAGARKARGVGFRRDANVLIVAQIVANADRGHLDAAHERRTGVGASLTANGQDANEKMKKKKKKKGATTAKERVISKQYVEFRFRLNSKLRVPKNSF